MYMVESTKMFVAERRRKHERRACAGCSHCVGSCVCVCVCVPSSRSLVQIDRHDENAALGVLLPAWLAQYVHGHCTKPHGLLPTTVSRFNARRKPAHSSLDAA